MATPQKTKGVVAAGYTGSMTYPLSEQAFLPKAMFSFNPALDTRELHKTSQHIAIVWRNRASMTESQQAPDTSPNPFF